MSRVFEIFFDDLNDDTKEQLVEFLGGENGNYDVIPLARIELDEDEDEEEEEEYMRGDVERLLDAVDFVCLNCGEGEESCEVCPVRKMVERIEEGKKDATIL